MGKNLKGRECGKGICQRKDGRYYARYVADDGVQHAKYFKTLAEARNWIFDERNGKNAEAEPQPAGMTVNQWFTFWAENIISDLAPNTIRNYRERYIANIKPVIGEMAITSVKPMHCKAVLNKMDADYSGSSIRQTYIVLGIMMKAALLNDIIDKNPLNGVKFTKPVRSASDCRFLTVEEQIRFLEAAKRSHNYRQYVLILETGLRTSELIGLTWDSINWEEHTLTVSKTLEYRYKADSWRAGPPKTRTSYRTIPLTDRAYGILLSCYNERHTRKESDILNNSLEYTDKKHAVKKHLNMRDLVFVNWRTGEPAKNSSYDTHLYKLCEEAGIKHFSMHALRHTYATRAIEAGVPPKVLQRLLGHSSLSMTMDRYVHVTDDSLQDGVRRFQSASAHLNCVKIE